MNWFSKLGRKNDKKPKFRKKSYGYSWKFFVTVVCRSIKKQAVPADSCFWKNFIATVCRSIKNIYGKLSAFLISRREEELLNSKGVILIEFAVCMPILIILMFYINDLVKIKRYYSQTEFVGQQMANIIQNISQKRAQSYSGIERQKQLRINLTDVARASKLASLTIYPGLTQTSGLMHYPYVNMYYIKNNKNGTATSKWRNYWSTGSTSSSCTTSGTNCSAVYWKANASPSAIYPTLKLNTEDGKIIIEMYMRKSSGDTKNTYGLRLVTPKSKSTNCTCCEFFQSAVIFTPKPGLFYDGVVKSSYADTDF